MAATATKKTYAKKTPSVTTEGVEVVKIDIYESITNRIVTALESGVMPWLKPWGNKAVAGSSCRPLRSCGTPYSGVNVLQLWFTADEKGYTSPYWMTFNQAKEFKGSVRKGEKGTTVVYASTFNKEQEQPDGTTVDKKIPFLKTYVVFNADQIENLDEKYYVVAEKLPEVERNEAVEKFYRCVGSDVTHTGNRAFYSATFDRITMPKPELFDDMGKYYSTLSHEHIHWTGGKAKLNRDLTGRFGSESYAMEELVAELGAAFVCADLGVTPEMQPEHAQYIASWIKALKGDKRAIFTAASMASRAVELLHSKQY